MAQTTNHTEIEIAEDALDEESVITSIANAIATLENDDPTAISPLYYTINTDALNQLFASTTEDQHLQFDFTHDTYDISIQKDTAVRITVSG